jgi:AcrR family transcriptional regulator
MNDHATATRPIDRRAARTRARLHDALLALIGEKGYEPTVVKNICQRAGVSRSAFYAHYASKDDLLRGSLENLRQLACSQPGDRSAQEKHTDARLTPGVRVLQHARDHACLHKSLGDRGVAIAHERVRAILSDLVRGELSATARETSRGTMPRELIVQYIVGAYMAGVSWWLDGGTRLPAAQVDGMLRRLATHGTAGLS